MQLKPEQLDTHLNKNLAPVYFISGDDPLRVLEAADAVRSAARKQGYDEREVLTVQAGFDWNSLLAEAGNLSLFAQRRVIDLRLPSGKPGKEGAEVLRAFAEQAPEDTLLLVTAGKLEPQARRSKWVQTLDRAGVVVFVWPLQAGEIAGWVHARMRKRGLQPSPEAVQMLAERVEGNLLACVQEIDKLFLLQGAGAVDVADITRLVADHARYDVFTLVDSALAGQAARSVRILNSLQAEGVAPPVVLWALAREIRQLAGMAAEVAKGQAVSTVLSRYRVWQSRQAPVGAALKRLPLATCRRLLRQCASVERLCKGQAAGNAWDELLQLTMQLAGSPVLSRAAQAEPVY
jgi:DNA polymerase-3 subunit delta